jgi:hypothetical protein
MSSETTGLGLGVPELVILALILVLIVLFFMVWYRILWKCTGNGWLCIFMVIPLLNLLVLIYAAACDVPDLSKKTDT